MTRAEAIAQARTDCGCSKCVEFGHDKTCALPVLVLFDAQARARTLPTDADYEARVDAMLAEKAQPVRKVRPSMDADRIAALREVANDCHLWERGYLASALDEALDALEGK